MNAQIRRHGRRHAGYKHSARVKWGALFLVTLAALFVVGGLCGQPAYAGTVSSFVNHLLALFYGNGLDRWLLLRFYRHQQPGMPAGWYGPYVRFMIIHYPRAMGTCLRSLQHAPGFGAAQCP